MRMLACLEIHRLLALYHPYEITGDDAALMNQLVEGVLAVCAWLAEVDLPSFKF